MRHPTGAIIKFMVTFFAISLFDSHCFAVEGTGLDNFFAKQRQLERRARKWRRERKKKAAEQHENAEWKTAVYELEKHLRASIESTKGKISPKNAELLRQSLNANPAPAGVRQKFELIATQNSTANARITFLAKADEQLAKSYAYVNSILNQEYVESNLSNGSLSATSSQHKVAMAVAIAFAIRQANMQIAKQVAGKSLGDTAEAPGYSKAEHERIQREVSGKIETERERDFNRAVEKSKTG